MKSIWIAGAVLVACILASFTFQKKDNALCRINRVNGMEAYILCEPLGDYQLLGDAKTGLKASSLLTGGLVNESIADKISQFVKRAQKTHPTMNGVVYTAGKNIGAFSWKTEAKKDDRFMARAQKVDGKYAFVMSEPEAEYVSLGTVKGGIKWKSAVTGGLVNNSIEEDISKFMKRAQEDHPTLDAIVYSSGKSAIAIQFKK